MQPFSFVPGRRESALYLLPSIPLKGLETVFAEEGVAFPPGGQTQLPMQPEFFSDRVFLRSLCISQMAGEKLRPFSLVQQSLWLQSCRAPWTGTPSLTHLAVRPLFWHWKQSQHPGLGTPFRGRAETQLGQQSVCDQPVFFCSPRHPS